MVSQKVQPKAAIVLVKSVGGRWKNFFFFRYCWEIYRFFLRLFWRIREKEEIVIHISFGVTMSYVSEFDSALTFRVDLFCRSNVDEIADEHDLQLQTNDKL